MTTLNFALTRTVGRELQAGDEIVVTQLDHDAQRLAVARARPRPRPRRPLRRHPRRHDARPRRPRAAAVATGRASSPSRSPRTRSGRSTDVARGSPSSRTTPARSPGPTPSTTAPHGPIDVAALGVDVLHLLAVQVLRPAPRPRLRRGAELLERWRPYKVRPAPDEPLGHRFETGTLPHELLAGFVAAVEYIESIGWDGDRRARARARRALPRRAARAMPRCYGLPTMDGRVPTFALQRRRARRRGGRDAARRARLRGLARQLLRGRGDEAARPRGRRRRRPRRASSTTTRPTRSTGCSRSSRRSRSELARRVPQRLGDRGLGAGGAAPDDGGVASPRQGRRAAAAR